MRPIATLAILILGMTVASATEPVKVEEGTCNIAFESLPCDKYLYKGNVYILVWKDGELWRLVKLTDEGEQLIYQAPKRYWI